MHRIKPLLTILALLFSSMNMIAHGKHYFTITDSDNAETKQGSTYFFADKKGEHSFSNILVHPEYFTELKRNFINFGIQTSTVWLHMNILNATGSEQDITINLNNSDLNYISFYELRNGKLVNKKVTGERVMTNDPILYQQGYNYQFALSAESITEIYVKIKNNNDAIVIPFSVLKTQTFLKNQHINTMKDIFLYGFLCLIIIISLITYTSLRQKQFLYFGFYVMSTLMLTATVNGYVYKFFLTDFPVLADKMRIFAIYSAVLFSGLYSATYLGLKQWSIKKYKLFIIFLYSFYATSIFASSDGFTLLMTFYLYLIYALGCIGGILFFAILRRKEKPFQSTILIISFILPFISVSLMFLRNIGLFEHHTVLIGFDYTIAIQSVVLIFGLVKTSRENEITILSDLKVKNLEIAINNDKLSSANKQLKRLTIASSKTENGIAIFDTQNQIEWHNDSFHSLLKDFGCNEKEECPAQTRLYNHIAKCIDRKCNISFNLVNFNEKKAGDIYRVSLTPLLNDSQIVTSIIAVFTDISEIVKAHQENKRLNDLLMQSQKMETIGKLAGGIAHDFNNLLTPIIGYSEMMLDDAEDETNREDLSIIHNSALRAKQLVAQILSFSKYFKEVKKHVAIHDLIDEVVSILKSALPSNIQMHFDKGNENYYIYADPTQIHQVILNICTNAKQAIAPNNGTISISTSKSTLEVEGANVDSVTISISDTGSGIPPKMLSNIFTPFFTTKSKSKGTGLGLSIAKDIITKYNGQISVESILGKGTLFSITLPTNEDEIPAEDKTRDTIHSGSGKRIMLVDDNQEITDMLKRLLTNKKYKVDCYNSSLKALNHFRKHSQDYFAVITDQTMPEISGDKLSENMIQHKKDIKIIIITGYSETLTVEKSKEIGIKKMLLKPLDSDTLLSALEDL